MTSYGLDARAKTPTAYFRRTVTLETVPTGLKIDLVADDGAVVYLNGVEVVRDNMGPGSVLHTTYAASNRSGWRENAARGFTVPSTLLHPGTNVIAVEVH